MSVRQAEGLDAVFECLYPGDGIIHSLIVNGSVIDANVPSGDPPASLTVSARPEYNNTVVQCEATVRVGEGREYVLSDSATLTVYGRQSPQCTHTGTVIGYSFLMVHCHTRIYTSTVC